MASKQSTTPTPGGVRVPLANALPLDTPYLVQMFPCYACNFRCGYCIYSLERERRGFISNATFMDFELYKKCIDDMKSFPRRLKMLRFAAIGEPLLHPQIADMVRYAKSAGIASSIDIVTNGSRLSPELSDALIRAGLSRLRISLEGLSSMDYERNAGVKIDFKELVDNIGYFYRRSESTHVYVKIIDYMLKTPKRESLFFNTFAPICHSYGIEHLTPTISEIDYDGLLGGMAAAKPHNGGELLQAEICPQPFYMMQINPDGKVVPCCSMKYPVILGDANKSPVVDIWNGQEYNSFRLHLLESREKASRTCKQCNLYRYDLHKEDVLDASAEQLKALYAID